MLLQLIPLPEYDAAKSGKSRGRCAIDEARCAADGRVFVHVRRLKQLSERKQLLHPPVQNNWALTRP